MRRGEAEGGGKGWDGILDREKEENDKYEECDKLGGNGHETRVNVSKRRGI